ncbi:hypothetical protein ABID08_003721 [Rhizobium binae]|uniref:MipA/OmpV family protein n=1 Tax=Rhizobium binae TaxID=1138190 RepID=A0ABV2MIQ5_9HYPH
MPTLPNRTRPFKGTSNMIDGEAAFEGGLTERLSLAPFARRGYGVSAEHAAASGLDPYKPSSDIQSYGAGAALTWKATENLSASSFLEYKRLAGPAADSSLVRDRGSKNQVVIGVSATYRFNFSLQ